MDAVTETTLEHYLASLSEAEFARAASSVPHHRALEKSELQNRLFSELINHTSIQRRLDVLPVPEVATVFSQAVSNGGLLELAHALPAGSSLPPEMVKDILEKYFLGSLITHRSNGSVDVCLFPEIAISYLRHARPALPSLFELDSIAERFAADAEQLMARSREQQFPIIDSSLDQFEEWARKDAIRCDPSIIEYLHIVLRGERLEERLAQVEHQPFKPFDLLTDRERCRRVFVHLITSNAHPLASTFAHKVVQVIRSLEEHHWFAPSTIAHLVVLEERRFGQIPDLDNMVENGSPFIALTERLETFIAPIVRLSGIVETARDRGTILADRLTRDGVQAVSQRIDWRHWDRLSPAGAGTRADAITSNDEDPVQISSSVLDWEGGFDEFDTTIKKFYLAIRARGLPITLKKQPDRKAFKQLTQFAGIDPDITNYLLKFAISIDHIAVDESRCLCVTPKAMDTIDDWHSGNGRQIASFFWQESFDDGAIAEDFRELKHIFVQEFLAQSTEDDFVRLTEFWTWLSEASHQQNAVQQWRRYVDEDDEVLHSITLSIARSMAWLGMAEASPDLRDPQFLRLTPEGRSWLVHYRFKACLREARNPEIRCEKHRLLCDYDVGTSFAHDLLPFTELQMNNGSIDFTFTSESIRRSVSEGHDPNRLNELLDGHLSKELHSLLVNTLEQINATRLRPASGYLELASETIVEEIMSSSLSAYVAIQAGTILILKSDASLSDFAKKLHEADYPTVWEKLD